MDKVIKILLACLIVINLLGCSTLAKKQKNTNELFIPEIKYSEFKLKNGLQIYVLEDDKSSLVNFSLWYKVGSIDEPKGISGISHLLEHNMFLGTKNLLKDQIHQLVKSVGGVNNAGTYYDYTMYYEEVPTAKLELAMAIEADRMRNLKINSQEFAREKKVVKQERRMRVENNIFQSALEEIQAEAFENSSLNHQIIGWMNDINNITTTDLRNYYTKYYAPNNAVMVVSGGVNPDDVHKLAEKYYSDYRPQRIDRLQVREINQEKEKLIKVEKTTKVPIIAMMYKIPRGNHPDIVAINVLMNILINNSSSRVKVELKQKRGMILEAGAFTVALREPGYLLAYMIPMTKDRINQTKTIFDQELRKIIEEGITENELKIVKKSTLKKIIFNQKDISNVAHMIAKSVVRYNDPQFYQTEIKRLKNLKEEDIIRVAKKYFRPENRTVGYIVPKNN